MAKKTSGFTFRLGCAGQSATREGIVFNGRYDEIAQVQYTATWDAPPR